VKYLGPAWGECLGRNRAVTALRPGMKLKVAADSADPGHDSEPPVPKKHRGIALLPAEQMLLIDSATGPWCLPMFLELSAATGARRGEVLAFAGATLKGRML
jgi:hypothetical protein